MKNTFWSRRVPSILGLLFLVVSIGSLSWMSKNVLDLRGKAAAGEIPKNIQITNVTDTAFTVSYSTDDSVLGTIGYAQDPKGGKVGLDERDEQTGIPVPRKMHSITVQDLTPSTTYYFTIVSGSTAILNSGQPFTITTGPLITAVPSNQAPLLGKVNLPDGSVPPEAVAYVSTDSSQKLSVVLKQDGGYVLPLNALRTADLTAYASLSAGMVLHMTIVSPTLTSAASVLASQTNPVPLITLSQNYDFTVSIHPLLQSVASASPSAEFNPTEASSAAGFASLIQGPSGSPQATGGPSIQTPQSAEKFSDQQPLFQGTATPNGSVTVTIQSTQEVSATVQADAQGNWQFRPSTKLSPGQHTLTIVTKDVNGVLQTISRQFTVFASGSQFIEPSITPTASPSATPTPSIGLVPTATTAPTSVPTAVPTASASATPTLLPTPTTNPSTSSGPTAVPTSSVLVTQPPLPKTGTSAVLLGGIAVLLSIGAGFLLFLGGVISL